MSKSMEEVWERLVKLADKVLDDADKEECDIKERRDVFKAVAAMCVAYEKSKGKKVKAPESLLPAPVAEPKSTFTDFAAKMRDIDKGPMQ